MLLKLLGYIPKPIKYFIREKLNIWAPPGHYYSPIPSIKEVKKNRDKIYKYDQKFFPAINLNLEKQLELIKSFNEYKADIPSWPANKNKNFRYYYQNDFFNKFDTNILCFLMGKIKPKRIIEVGSGFSSAVMMDMNEKFFQNGISLTFVEPNPTRLKSLLKKTDNVEFIQKKLQDVPVDFFSQLEKNDFLFIDSSHVSKTGSDVNYLFFEVLPILKSGVYVHFHDIIHPFEYLERWVYEARAWNEAYTLRAFLQYNNDFEIVFFNSYMQHFYKDLLFTNSDNEDSNNSWGGSFWIRKK